MMQNLFAAFSLLIGAAGLMLTYTGHRQKARQDAQDRALSAEERSRAGQDREQERQRQEEEARARQEREARARRAIEARDRERDRYQASMVRGYIGLSPSSLDDGWVIPQIVIYNGSNQPVRNVRASFCGEVTEEQHLVGTGHHVFPLGPMLAQAKGYEELGSVIVEFTDVAGIRWRREGSGALQRARPIGDGQTIWGEPELPVVERADEHTATMQPMPPPATGLPLPLPQRQAPAPSGPPAMPPALRRAGRFERLVVLVSLVLIAGGIWWFVH